MRLTLNAGGQHIAPIDLVLLTVAVLLMLGGAALLVADMGSAGIWIPVIAIGIVLTVIVQGSREGRGGAS